MKKLAGAISEIIIDEYGTNEFLKRLSNPYFFQSLGCVIGFDWHSSGLTTTTLGALKEALNQNNLGIQVAGGKGKISKNTLTEIDKCNFSLSERKIAHLKYSSRMSAKVDNCLVQDSYQLYHHSFIFNENGNWAVIQQGMNSDIRYARRYHWISGDITNFIEEPHNAICCDSINDKTLDLTSKNNNEIKKISVDLVKDNPNHLKKYFVDRYLNMAYQKTLNEFTGNGLLGLSMGPRHTIVDMDKRNIETLKKAYEFQPQNYEELVAIKGVGAKTIRALALISELVYGCELSWKDPVKYSFAFGGKDKIPYPIDKKHYDKTIEIMKNAIKNAKVGNKEKLFAIKRLSSFYSCLNFNSLSQ